MRVVGIMRYLIGALCLQELIDQGEEIVGVVVSTLDPMKGLPLEESVKLKANRNLLPVYQIPMRDVNTPEFIEVLKKLEPDLIVSAYPPVTYTQALLDVPRLGVVNLHPSKLPCGRGFATSIYHMIMGEDKNWITLHFLDAGVDTGDIISQGYVDITPEDIGYTVRRKLFKKAARLLAEALPLIRSGEVPRLRQDQITDPQPSVFNWDPSFGRIQWGKSSEIIAHLVRTLSHPKDFAFDTDAAYTYMGGKKVFVWKAEVFQSDRWENMSASPGTILAILGEGLLVRTGQGLILITDATIEGFEKHGLTGLFDMLGSGVPVLLG
jgi:methionyl-tRNA formyltransferase